ncbi:DUF885 family protein [Sphingomonas crusticola]|uniref:DUF885 family protein n=1 Tax=Sphingomonas crusticola TaxID=1697973 RepID=UPI0013C2A82F|nr:DUF885 family protein [Sphingomonas crusticola]
MIDRRTVIAGGALLAIGAAPGADRRARILLDEAASLLPAERLRLLRAIETAGLSEGVQLDAAAALRGADLERRLATAAPGQRYAFQLRLQSGIDISPDLAHRRALDASTAFTRRADRLLRQQGLVNGTVAERLRTLARDPRFLYSDDDAGRARAVADMNVWLAAARARLPSQFGRVLPASLGVSIVRMTPAEEGAGKAGYRSLPAPDGAVAGAYHVDLHAIRQRPSWSLPSVVHHETLPGHMVQSPLQAAVDPHPLRLKAAAGFVEGWAIYAEQLAAEAGAYAAEPRAAIGYCQWMLFRLGRLLVDTGVNYLGWSTDKALDTLRGLQGDPVIFAPFAKDVARMAAEPASFAGQALTWLEIVQRRNASISRGDGAGLRRFHDRVLAHGAIPLALF